MIRTEREYKVAQQDYCASRERTEALRRSYVQEGYDENTIDLLLAPVIAFDEERAYDIQTYERALRREFGNVPLSSLGRLLISLRIARQMSQRELAQRLGVDESVVSRDERNEYHGITIDRAQRVLTALEETITLTAFRLPA